MTHARAEALLHTWFGEAPLDDAAAADARNRRWFQAQPEFDALLLKRYGDLPARCRAGEFAGWRDDARGMLARVVALDQLPRNVHRGTPFAFAYDTLALASATQALDLGHDQALHPLQAVFLYLPFEHAEDPGAQARCVELFTRLRARAPASLATHFDGYLDYARRHAEVIERFGRFPHRNAILGRPATPAEDAYLAAGGQRF